MANILIVDDNLDNRYMLEVLLRNNGFDTTSAANGKEALEMAIAAPPEMIVSDILMPVMDGFILCKKWKADERLRGIPFVFYTATYTEPQDIKFGLSLGADRFLLKPLDGDVLLSALTDILAHSSTGEPASFDLSLEEEMELLKKHNEALFRKLEKKIGDLEQSNGALREEIGKRILIENNLRQSDERLRTLLNTLPVGLAWADTRDATQHVNGKFTELFGFTVEDIPAGEEWSSLIRLDPAADGSFRTSWTAAIETARKTRTPTPVLDLRVTCKNGSVRDMSAIGAVIGTLHLGIFTDVTERKQLEEQLNQAQKLESVGNLAGGIAHDFNNILTAITGFAGLLQMKMDVADPLLSHVKELASAGMRGAALTHQLLAFSRKQILDMKPVDLNVTLTNLEKMLRRLIREDITLNFGLTPDRLQVLADANQVEQVVINLVTNARDSMPSGGSLEIATATAVIDEVFVRQRGYGDAGHYAVITIRDSGTGMDAETKRRIFEPFFTTKETGKGTGLGLSVVYGIISQHKGMIFVDSEPGAGSLFTVYLPLLKGDIDAGEQMLEETGREGGSETILVAEDNEVLRNMTITVLESHGYRVIPAADGKEALQAFRANRTSIDMVILDLIMPGKRGFDVYREIEKEEAHTKVLFVTGYSEDEVERGEIRGKALPLLSKPYTPYEFLRQVRRVLDGRR
jgi:two-component system, cell cycle sensor histidine kinase and response regulator CckA